MAKQIKKPAKRAKAAKKTKKSSPKKIVKRANKTSKKNSKKIVSKTVKKVVKKPAKKAAKKNTGKKVSRKIKPDIKKAVKAKSQTVPEKSKNKAVKQTKVLSRVSNKTSNPTLNTNQGFVQHKTKLRPGNTAPYFEGKDQNGNTVNLYSLSGKTVVLFFYPKDNTEGCIKEVCSLRDEYPYLNANNYMVIGVSADDINSHFSFASKYNLPYPLIADTDKTIIRAYDVWGQMMLAGNIYDGIVRTTFIIDGYGIIQNVVTDVDTANHARQILAL